MTNLVCQDRSATFERFAGQLLVHHRGLIDKSGHDHRSLLQVVGLVRSKLSMVEWWVRVLYSIESWMNWNPGRPIASKDW